MSNSPSPLDQLDGPFEPLEGDTFQFACHPDVICFNRCCADLTLLLTPFDILELKNHLGLSSDRFLDEYTEVFPPTETDAFPRVQLKMTDRPGKPCPFVSEKGCTVYPARPGACRIYPLGRGSAKGNRELFFLVKEDHCQGFSEDRKWTVSAWMADQGLKEHNRLNDLWMEIITSRESLGPSDYADRKMQMFFMASYNLDRFRAFIFESPFLTRFEVDPDTVEAMRGEDKALLEFAFKWLRFALFGEKTIQVRS